jgi:hypothetical protein
VYNIIVNVLKRILFERQIYSFFLVALWLIAITTQDNPQFEQMCHTIGSSASAWRWVLVPRRWCPMPSGQDSERMALLEQLHVLGELATRVSRPQPHRKLVASHDNEAREQASW